MHKYGDAISAFKKANQLHQNQCADCYYGVALSGKILVIWATWCPPCRESVPELTWHEFVGKKNMDWAQYRGSDHKVLDKFGVHAFPTYLVITGDGIIKQRIVGMNPQQAIVHRRRETLASMLQLEGAVSK